MNVIHTVVNTFTAKRFVEPFILKLISKGYKSEIIVDDFNGDRKFLDSLSVNYTDSKFSLTLNPLSLFSRYFRLRSLFKLKKIDILHCHFTTGAILPLFVGFTLRIPKRVYHNHGVPYIGHKGPVRYLLLLIEFINCKLATDIITVSNGMIEPLSAVSNKNIRVFGNGSVCGLEDDYYSDCDIDLSIIDDTVKEKIIFLYVGRPFKRKGFNIILEAFTNSFSDVDDVVLLLAGCTQNEVDLVLNEKYSNIMGLGLMSDMKSLYHYANVVVLPSEHEGFGYALLEGGAKKCALISCDIPGPNDMVINDYSGFRFQVGDSKALSYLLTKLSSDLTLVKQLGLNACEQSKKFSRDSILDDYIRFVKELEVRSK